MDTQAQATYRTRTARRTSARGKWLGLLLCAAGVVLLISHLQDYFNPPADISEATSMALNPIVEKSKDLLIDESADLNIPIIITDGFRSASEQDRLYEQGRTASGSIVTNARGGESYHNYGLAIDFALLTDSGEVLWDTDYDGNGNGASDWLEVVDIAKNLGFEWGGDWEQPDYPHLEMNFGLSIRDLQRGKEAPVE